jgi:6-phosphogluconolactonase (cycloisomerase 2 family)
VSPEGRNVYAVGSPGGPIAVFARDEATGRLRQLAGRQGCVIDTGSEGCTQARVMDDVASVTAGPDGRNLYVACGDSGTSSDGGLAVFARDPQTGSLRQLGGRAGCLRPRGRGNWSPARAVESASAVAVSADGRNVYTASDTGRELLDGALAVFARSLG